MFLTARLFLYQQVYFHRTVRAIDLDLRGVRDRRSGRSSATAHRPNGCRLRRPRRVRPPPPGRPLGARRVGHRAGRRRARAGRWTGHAGSRRDVAGDPAAPAALAFRRGIPCGVRGGRATRGAGSRPWPARTRADRDRPRRGGCPAGRRDRRRFAARGRGRDGGPGMPVSQALRRMPAALRPDRDATGGTAGRKGGRKRRQAPLYWSVFQASSTPVRCPSIGQHQQRVHPGDLPARQLHRLAVSGCSPNRLVCGLNSP